MVGSPDFDRGRWGRSRPWRQTAAAHWALEELAGRLGELSGLGASAQLSLAFSLVLDAQARHEPVAWITGTASSFFPPDAAACGVDLASLPVVFTPDPPTAGRAAERLVRSGAFGLVVLDLIGLRGVRGRRHVPVPLQSRLAGLCQRHDTALLALTEKGADEASIGALVSLRCEARREEEGARHLLKSIVLKDKRRGAGWEHAEVWRGPAGLC